MTPATDCIAVAYSGGRDSTALLFATARMAQERGQTQVVALHVHHGISAHADAWLAHAQHQCQALAEMGLPVRLETRQLKLSLGAGQSVEAVARDARYQALAEMAREAGASAVLLAHHRQDQAETFLLQAMRGAGTAGLAAMPAAVEREGVIWYRPWLNRDRAEIDAYVAQHGLQHIDDDTNQDVRYARNRLRLNVMPTWRAQFPQVDQALSHAAQHCADADWCLAQWSELRLQALRVEGSGAGLNATAWAACEGPERRELLRRWYQAETGRSLSRAWVLRLDAEAPPAAQAGHPAHWPEVGVGVYRGVLSCFAPGAGAAQTVPHASHAPALDLRAAVSITGPGRYDLQPAQGVLVVEAITEGHEPGVPWAALASLSWRWRAGGEDFQLAKNRPVRSLKKQFQSVGVPAWLRETPILWSQDRIVLVPGLGIDARILTETTQSRARLTWVSLPQGPVAG